MSHTAFYRARQEQCKLQYWASLFVVLLIVSAGTHTVNHHASLWEQQQYSFVHLTPFFVAYKNQLRVHRELFVPRPERKGIPVYVCKSDILHVLWLGTGFLAALYTPISHAAANQSMSMCIHVAEMYVFCSSLRRMRMHNLIWATLLAILLLIGGVELNPGPHGANAFGTLDLDALSTERIVQCTQGTALPFLEQTNIQGCWDACQANLIKIRQLAFIGNLETVAVICYACNVCYDNSMLCRLEHLMEESALWLSGIGESGAKAALAEVLDTTCDLAGNSALIQQAQTYKTPWNRVGTNYFDSSAVAAMVRLEQNNVDKINTCHPQSKSSILDALSIVNSRVVLTIDIKIAHVFAGVKQRFQTLIVPMLGDQHFRLIIFHNTSQSIYVWDPFGKERVPTDVLLAMQHVYDRSIHDIDIPLQQDGCNCGFWVAYFSKIFYAVQAPCTNPPMLLTALNTMIRLDGAHTRSFGAQLRQEYYDKLCSPMSNSSTTSANGQKVMRKRIAEVPRLMCDRCGKAEVPVSSKSSKNVTQSQGPHVQQHNLCAACNIVLKKRENQKRKPPTIAHKVPHVQVSQPLPSQPRAAMNNVAVDFISAIQHGPTKQCWCCKQLCFPYNMVTPKLATWEKVSSLFSVPIAIGSQVCNTCADIIGHHKIPPMHQLYISHGLEPIPATVTRLTEMEERLVSCAFHSCSLSNYVFSNKLA